jgi:hypothetical protein
VAEGVGTAPTSDQTDPIFKTGAASLYLPAFQSGTRERTLTFISDVRSAVLYRLSYASKIHQGAPKTRPGHYFGCAWPLPAVSLHPGKMAAQVGFAPTPARLTGG